jgi:hypothetical protein
MQSQCHMNKVAPKDQKEGLAVKNLTQFLLIQQGLLIGYCQKNAKIS